MHRRDLVEWMVREGSCLLTCAPNAPRARSGKKYGEINHRPQGRKRLRLLSRGGRVLSVLIGGFFSCISLLTPPGLRRAVDSCPFLSGMCACWPSTTSLRTFSVQEEVVGFHRRVRSGVECQ